MSEEWKFMQNRLAVADSGGLEQAQPFVESAISEYRNQFILVQEENEVLKDRMRELNVELQKEEQKFARFKE